jgi:hypothetical protein
MRTRTKITGGLAALLLACFFWGISDTGQRFLIGNPSADHWIRDDQYMGAGLAPIAYCLVPSIVMFALTIMFLVSERKHSN